jgi:hypothetical protein
MNTFEIQLMYTLVILLAFSSSLAFGAFLGWLLFERKNAPFRDLGRGDDE